jgi:microcystin-dependent protein
MPTSSTNFKAPISGAFSYGDTHMAGFWPQSLSQPHDNNGKPFPGARVYFYLGGTTTPMEVYRDYGLGVPHTNPVQADGIGTFPAVFLDQENSFYRQRITTAQGVLLSDVDGIPIISPVASGGGDPVAPVDPDALMKTGDMMLRYGEEFRSGFVRHNGRSIGSATSGASERANADCQNLFEYLWNLSANIVIEGGRGVSAAADWAANKRLVLPSVRGRSIVGLDTMGNTAAGILPAANEVGWVGGERLHTMTITEMPNHDHALTDPGHGHNWGNTARAFSVAAPGSSGGFLQGGTAPGELVTTNSATGITMAKTGGGTPFSVVQPSAAYSLYQRL